ncbi:MAG: PLDc N-terminal domain-containing protein [Desulforhopalus sp.]
MGIEVSGILSLLILIADIWAIENIFQSSATAGMKVLWIVIVILLPILGLIAWYLAGPKPAR